MTFNNHLVHRCKNNIFQLYSVGYGITTDGVTTFVNASSVTIQYRPSHPPIVFDLPNKESLDQSWFNLCSIHFLLSFNMGCIWIRLLLSDAVCPPVSITGNIVMGSLPYCCHSIFLGRPKIAMKPQWVYSQKYWHKYV